MCVYLLWIESLEKRDFSKNKNACKRDGKERLLLLRGYNRECLGLWSTGTCIFHPKEKAVTPWLLLIVAQWKCGPISTGFPALYKVPDFELLA